MCNELFIDFKLGYCFPKGFFAYRFYLKLQSKMMYKIIKLSNIDNYFFSSHNSNLIKLIIFNDNNSQNYT